MRELKFRAYYQKVTNDKWVIEGEYTMVDLTDRGILFDQVRIKWVQYTGLKDKNGKEIYEGDIVKIYGSIARDDPAYGYYESEMEVIYSEVWGAFGFTDGGAFLYFKDKHNFEIIGNIHENPELCATR